MYSITGKAGRRDGLHQAFEAARPEGDGIRPGDAGDGQRVHGFGDDVVIGEVVLGQGEGRVIGTRADAVDAGGRIAMEGDAILGDGDLVCGLAHGVEVGVLGAAADRLQFVARQFERHAQLDQRLDPAPVRLDPLCRRFAQRLGAADIDGRGLPAEGPREVDETARRQGALERAPRFFVDGFPRRLGDRRKFPKEIVHVPVTSRRLPMPSEPSLPPSPPLPSAPPVTASSTCVMGPSA
jgi:hypothetical protein